MSLFTPLNRSLAVLGLASCAVVFAAPAAIQKQDGRNAQFAQALRELKEGRATAAYGDFMRLADRGDAESARIALIMLRHGPEMHGAGWGASQPQIDRWMKLARQPMEPLTAESGD
ncbi:MAG: hypothetical protein JWN73_925 [Betaproteobacteria bacterium]|nr:hypothetical protein [Betaproteobacteria bacterium]